MATRTLLASLPNTLTIPTGSSGAERISGSGQLRRSATVGAFSQGGDCRSLLRRGTSSRV